MIGNNRFNDDIENKKYQYTKRINEKQETAFQP